MLTVASRPLPIAEPPASRTTGSVAALNAPLFIVTTDVTVTSTVDFDTAGARTVHHLPIAIPPFAGGTVQLTADGAFGLDHARADVEGIIGLSAGAVGADCQPATGQATLPAQDLATLVADRDVTVTVTDDPTVTPRCPVNRHTVSLTYPAVTERIDFAPTRAQSTATIAVTLRLLGSDALTISTSLQGDGFELPDAVLVLPPGIVQTIILSFHPPSSGSYSGTLTLTPAAGAPPMVLTLTGTGVPQPAVSADPLSLAASLRAGHDTSQTLILRNPGTEDLDLTVSVEGRPVGGGSPDLCTSPTAYVLEGDTSVLAQVGLNDGSVLRRAPQIFGASSLALSPDASAAYIGTFQGDLYRLDLSGGTRLLLNHGTDAILDLAASLDGTALYVLRNTGIVERFDVAASSRSTLVAGLNGAASLDMGPSGVLYVATAVGLLGFDSVSGAPLLNVPELAHAVSPRVDERRGVVVFSGQDLHSVNVFDLTSRQTRLVALPAGSGYSRLGLSSEGRFVYGLDQTARTLTRIDTATGSQTPIGGLFASPRDLEIRADASCLGTFLTVTPSALSLAAGTSTSLAAKFSAAGVAPGQYGAAVLVREPGNDIVLATVPVVLTVVSAPRLDLLGTPQVVEQRRDDIHPDRDHYSNAIFSLVVATAPTTDGVLEITTAAAVYQQIAISLEGTSLGSQPVPQCVVTTRSFPVPFDPLNRAASDGVVDVRLDLAPAYDDGQDCQKEFFTAKLTSSGFAGTIDFGEVPFGTNAGQPLRLRNGGDQALQVQGLRVDGDGFEAAPSSLTLSPGTEAVIDVGFAASQDGRADGLLAFSTNDPDIPSVTIPLVAHAVRQPAAVAGPASLQDEAIQGAGAAATISIRNDGGLPLDFALSVAGSGDTCPAQYLLTAGLSAIDLVSGEVLSARPTSGFWGGYGQVNSIALDPTGRTAYLTLGGWAGGIAGGDWRHEAISFLQGSGRSYGVAYRRDRDTVLFIGMSGIEEFDPRTQSIGTLDTGAYGEGMAITRDGTTAYITNPGHLDAFDLKTNTLSSVAGGLASPQGMSLNADESAAYVVEMAGGPGGDRLTKIDLPGGAATPVLSGLSGSEAVAIDTTREVAYIGEEILRRVVILNLRTGAVTTLAEGVNPAALALVPQAGCSGRFVDLPLRYGTLAPGESQNVPVTLTSEELAPGSYTATLLVKSNDPARPRIEIPVRFEVLADTDGDGIPDVRDNCPGVANADQADADHDGRGDVCDNCPGVPNADQADRNNDGAGDACQPDVTIDSMRQSGDGFLVVHATLVDPLGAPLSGLVTVTSHAGGPIQVPYTGRPPRRIDLSGLVIGASYRLEVSATNGLTPPFIADATFVSQGERTLAFNDPPVAALSVPAAAIECDAPAGGLVPLSAAGSTDADSTPGTEDDIASYEWILNPGQPDERLLATGPAPSVRLLPGTYALELRVTDRLGESATATASVTVVDSIAPVVVVHPEPAVLWPPNHRMRNVTIRVEVADACDPSPRTAVLSVTSSEPDDSSGDVGRVTAQPGLFVVPLRAERSGDGPGRTYRIEVTSTDASSNRSVATATVTVPHDPGKPAPPVSVPRPPVAPAPVPKP
jgi:hypothetical protein